jgi:LPS-assembly lipoprotein
LAIELRRSFGDSVRVLAPHEPISQAQVVLDILQEQREKTVVGVSSSGQVREFQLRIRVKFRVRNREGDELTPPAEIVQQRDMSFSESAVLAKEAEEVLLYRDMQSDMVQQLMRRLAAIK